MVMMMLIIINTTMTEHLAKSVFVFNLQSHSGACVRVVFSGPGNRCASEKHFGSSGTKRSSWLSILRPANSTNHLA